MKSSIFSLVLTVFLLWLTIQIESSFEVYLAYFFVLTVGIVHGANDISLINHINQDSKGSKIKYLGLYISVIVFMSLAFFNFPFIALCVFVVFSCYHFGEQHFYNQLKDSTGLKANTLFISYGALIFALLFYLNAEETTKIIQELTSVRITENHLLIFLIGSFALTLISIALNFNNFENRINLIQEAFLIIVFSLLFRLASLLWAFAIYFIIWHSIPSLRDQILALYGRLDKLSFYKYFKSSILNWVVSIFGLIVIYFISTEMNIRFITLFFAFLAAITIPHVIVMYFLNKK